MESIDGTESERIGESFGPRKRTWDIEIGEGGGMSNRVVIMSRIVDAMD